MSNSELNERDLEGVSGGGIYDKGKAFSESHKICGQCPKRKACGKVYEGLYEYMLEHGPSSVTNPTRCPYFNEAN